MSWLRQQWEVGSRLAAAQGVERVAGQLALAFTAAIAGSAALGQSSAARTLLTPFTTVSVAISTFAVPEAARLYHRSDGRLRLFLAGLSALLTASIVAFGILLYAVPASAGRDLFGGNWDSARVQLPAVLVWTAANAVRSGPLTGLQVMRRARSVLYISIAAAVALMAAVASGAYLNGARGAAWGFAVVSSLGAATYWVIFFTRIAAERKARHAKVPTGRFAMGRP
jgi:O-antigen/teichoic acid export membrane protein